MLFGIFCVFVCSALAWLAIEVQTLKQQRVRTMSAFANLQAAVQQQTTVDASAVTLIEGIVAELKTNSDANVQALADQLTAATQPLAAAVTANTPAATPAPAAAAPAQPLAAGAAPTGTAGTGSTASAS